MKAFEMMATVNTPNELKLDHTIDLETSSRVKVIVLVEDDSDSDVYNTPDEEIEDSLRRSLQEAKEGKRIPLSQMWEGIDAE